MLTTFAFVALATSAMATTTARSKLTAPFREWVSKKSPFLGGGLSCPYCMAHWYAFFLVLFVGVEVLPRDSWLWLNFIVSWFAVIAAAVIVNGAIMRLNFMHESEINRLEDQLAETRGILTDLVDSMKNGESV